MSFPNNKLISTIDISIKEDENENANSPLKSLEILRSVRLERIKV
jgi:hypothetical protein